MKRVKERAPDVTSERIRELTRELVSENAVDRMEARRELRQLGKSALPHLHALLGDTRFRARWEAAKVLAAIGSTESAPALAGALDDERSGVRWLAATGLLGMGREGVLSVLRAMSRNPPSLRSRSAAHHVLHAVQDEETATAVKPVADAIERSASAARVLVMAHEALERLEPRVS